MARPNKTGIDYFSFDVDFFNDEKIEYVSARFGIKGEIIAIRLLCKIYRNGYYTEWSEDESALLAKRAGDGISPALVSDIVKELVKRGFFEKDIFDRFQILTSRGIQRRYLEATKRCKTVDVKKEFLLVNVECLDNVNINSINVNINSKHDIINPQNKIKEKKVNKSKEDKSILIPPEKTLINHKEIKEALNLPFDSQAFNEAWFQLILLPKWKKKLPISLQKSLDKLKKYDEQFAIELINRAIEGNYQGLVFQDTDDYYNRWKLKKQKHSAANHIQSTVDDTRF